MLHRIHMESPFGTICIEDDGEALTALYLADQNEKSGEIERQAESVNKEADDEERKPENVDEKVKDADREPENLNRKPGSMEEKRKDSEGSELLVRAVTELQEYFAGKRTSFDLPLHPKGTEFQRQVWNALREIPYGETRSYGEIAQAVGRPKACRAVGGANNKNPIMLFIPCHRVIGSDGSLTGFAGGLDMKRRLLEMEAANRTVSAKVLSGGESKNCEIGEARRSYVSEPGNAVSLEDYYALPGDRRAELIDGVLYDMAAPSLAHQGAAAELYGRLRDYIVSQNGDCYPLISPFDVQLDRDDRTMVQPDVAVVCDRSRLGNRCVCGAPDLVIEILSDSSINRDCVLKLAKYMAAGVREYWIVDLENRRVLVYESGKEIRFSVHGMDGRVPVGIFNGNCEIDFSEIYQWVRFLIT